ncbi:unnamed protein product, partial [Polarella glacialis]
GYHTIGDLRSDGQETAIAFVTALGMPRGADERLLALSFQEDEDLEDANVSPEGLVKAKAAAARVAQVGSALDGAWLEAVEPLYSMHMGCENMGPMLYSLMRFVKPSCCLEIGAGYTSAFMLQALEDNARELQFWAGWKASRPSGSPDPSAESWLAPEAEACESRLAGGVLHCVDNFAHAHTTAPQLLRTARRLGLEQRLRLHLDDGRAFVEESADSVPFFDFVWLDGLLDFAPPVGGDVKAGIDKFLGLIWPRVAPGGFVLLHSTLTNSAVRSWLDGLAASSSAWGPPGQVLSLLEPHKRFQNSFTMLQRRPEGYAEPQYSKLP